MLDIIIAFLESITAFQWVAIIGGSFIAVWLGSAVRALRW